MIVRHATSAERESLGREADRCECGVAIDVHPPLARPLHWGHGRPCDRPVDFRRYDSGDRRDESRYR